MGKGRMPVPITKSRWARSALPILPGFLQAKIGNLKSKMGYPALAADAQSMASGVPKEALTPLQATVRGSSHP